MIGSFITITGRAGSARHILNIGWGETDQYTFGQLALDIEGAKPGMQNSSESVNLR